MRSFIPSLSHTHTHVHTRTHTHARVLSPTVTISVTYDHSFNSATSPGLQSMARWVTVRASRRGTVASCFCAAQQIDGIRRNFSKVAHSHLSLGPRIGEGSQSRPSYTQALTQLGRIATQRLYNVPFPSFPCSSIRCPTLHTHTLHTNFCMAQGQGDTSMMDGTTLLRLTLPLRCCFHFCPVSDRCSHVPSRFFDRGHHGRR